MEIVKRGILGFFDLFWKLFLRLFLFVGFHRLNNLFTVFDGVLEGLCIEARNNLDEAGNRGNNTHYEVTTDTKAAFDADIVGIDKEENTPNEFKKRKNSHEFPAEILVFAPLEGADCSHNTVESRETAGHEIQDAVREAFVHEKKDTKSGNYKIKNCLEH